MSKKRSKPVQLAPWSSSLVGAFDFSSLGEDPLGDMQVFAGAATETEIRQRLRAEVETEVEQILAAILEFDAFDIIELIRLRELPIAPVAALVHHHDGNGAAIDLIALVCLSRTSRMPSGKDRRSTEPHHAISDLHDRATRLLRLGTFAHTTAAAVAGEPLGRLAAEYQSYLVSVRKLQYDSVQDSHDAALFDRPEVDELLQSCLGFTYAEFKAVRTAIQERYSRVLTSLRDATGDLVMRCEAENRDPAPEEIERFRDDMSAFMFLPGERASFTVGDIADELTLDSGRVLAVLDTFSIEFDSSQSATHVIADFLRGVNPLLRTCLAKDENGNYLMTGGQIGTDSFRIVAESALKGDSKVWRRYDRTRSEVSESAALAAVGRALDSPVTHSNLKYYAPKQGASILDLGSACTSPKATGDQTECDGLFVIEDVALCIEVKGRTFAEPARRGDRARLANEIKAIFGEGARQAHRLEGLITGNRGLWLEDGSWLDLSNVREVRTIVVGLDFFGPLAVALGDLQVAGMLDAGTVPWIASLHDVDVISKVIDRPSEFLLYLRRRTDSGVAKHYRGADELDLFMLFLDGGLYVAEDPDEVRRIHPTAGPLRARDRKQHLRDARPTVVGTHTDPLDAWMYWTEGTSPYEAEKPEFNTHPAARDIVDFLTDGRKPGWFRFGADLLGLAGTAQKKLGDFLRRLVDQSKSDDKWHSMVQGYAGSWGYPMLFAGTAPPSHTHDESVTKLYSYMAAKKHRMKADRSLGLMLNNQREIVHVIYLNGLPTDDSELDALGETIGLRPAGEPGQTIPPSARRASRQLRGKRIRKRRR